MLSKGATAQIDIKVATSSSTFGASLHLESLYCKGEINEIASGPPVVKSVGQDELNPPRQALAEIEILIQHLNLYL